VAGDTWQEDCNRCKCTDNLLPGCTKKLCVTPTISQQRTTATNLCGSDERGVPRVVGDTWQEDCNRCRCTDNLVPGCTKRFCGAFPQPPTPSQPTSSAPRISQQNRCGIDERGVPRVAGDTWKEDCNDCRCTDNLVPGCTRKLCGAPTTSHPSSSAPRVGGVMFPGHSRGDPVTVTTLSCNDKNGTRREVGESWKEDCNNCRCGNTGVALCTHRFCINEEFKKDKFLFTVDSTKNVEEIVQCSNDGAKNCKAVKLNANHLSSTSTTDSQFLKLLPGSDVELEVVRGPADLSSDTLSYVFRLTDGGEGTLTVRQSTSKAYGSFKPIKGSVHYSVEACSGDGCNVIYERDRNFFNNFED